MKTFLSKIGFDKHHKFERFGVIFGSLCLALVIVISTAFVGKMQLDSKNMTNNVIYTTKFTTSISNINGTVNNIYRSKDKTKLFLLLNISDISNISVNAKNYQLFLTGCEVKGENIVGMSLEHKNVNGSIYMFGSTGYMGIYFVDNECFPSQLYDLVVRCNSKIVSSASSLDTDEDDGEKDSFSLYDQFRIYFNPGGADCDVAEFLDKDDWTIVDAYEECVSRSGEQELRNTLTTDIETMQSNLSAIDEYTERLKGLNVVVPDASSLIAGDEIVKDDDGHLTYKPKHVLASGFDYDWYNGSIKDGYLGKLCGDLTHTQYLSKKRTEVEGTQFSTSNIEWVLTDGTPVSDLDTEVSANKSITDTINLLTSSWNTYYANKKNYQCTDLKSLLYLELDSLNVESDYTINSDKDTALIVF